jgi:hypothetical protein
MMQRTEDKVALVAGTALGLGGGSLGAFLVCTAVRAVALRVLNQWEGQFLDLAELAPPTPRHDARSASLAGGASVTHPDNDPSPRNVPTASWDCGEVVSAR